MQPGRQAGVQEPPFRRREGQDKRRAHSLRRAAKIIAARLGAARAGAATAACAAAAIAARARHATPQQQPPLPPSLPPLPPARGSTLPPRRSARLSKAGADSAGSLREMDSNILETLTAVFADVSKKMPSISRAKASASSRRTSCGREGTGRRRRRDCGAAPRAARRARGQGCAAAATAARTHAAVFLVQLIAADGNDNGLGAKRLQLLDPVLQRAERDRERERENGRASVGRQAARGPSGEARGRRRARMRPAARATHTKELACVMS
jgi:hypothetical protein